MQTVNIAGGGLAGLGLGLALRRSGVPVHLHEAGTYPRHRVCGEFISGLSAEEWSELGAEALVKDCPRHDHSVWYLRDHLLLCPRLPEPALAVSRYELDAAMAHALTSAGGCVETGTRVNHGGDSWVRAYGRQRSPGKWLGLKAHYMDLSLEAGLEMHMGTGGYAGLTLLGGGRVNVCALLPAGPDEKGPRETMLPRRLRAIGLEALAARLDKAAMDSASLTGVTSFALGWQPGPAAAAGALLLGDQAAIIPPFTGNGMTMAMQSALAAAAPLAGWSAGRISWLEACALTHATLRRNFQRRMRWASWLHPLLLHRGGQRVLQAAVATRLLPFDWLFRRLRD